MIWSEAPWIGLSEYKRVLLYAVVISSQTDIGTLFTIIDIVTVFTCGMIG